MANSLHVPYSYVQGVTHGRHPLPWPYQRPSISNLKSLVNIIWKPFPFDAYPMMTPAHIALPSTKWAHTVYTSVLYSPNVDDGGDAHIEGEGTERGTRELVREKERGNGAGGIHIGSLTGGNVGNGLRKLWHNFGVSSLPESGMNLKAFG